MKLLSIIIPLYNSAQWVEKCLDSVLNQDVPMELMEIVCVNDGSPDNSAEIVRGKSEEIISKNGYSPIVVLEQENQGPSGARNNGMRHARGKYLMFVDPDDYVEPNTFGGLIAQMEREQLDMLRFNYQIVDENYCHVEKRAFEKAFDYSPQLMTGVEFLANRLDIACNIWRYIYRTEIITKNEIWCYTGDYYDDTPWLPLVLMKANKLNICDTIVYDYLERADSLVKANSPRMIQRKTDGTFLLFRLLEEQISKLDVLLPINTNATLRSKVMAWYKNIESHMVVGLFVMTAVYNFKLRYCHIQRVREMELLPISISKTDVKFNNKVKLVNASPLFFIWLVHLKHFRKCKRVE